jgi:hypothetical protein
MHQKSEIRSQKMFWSRAGLNQRVLDDLSKLPRRCNNVLLGMSKARNCGKLNCAYCTLLIVPEDLRTGGRQAEVVLTIVADVSALVKAAKYYIDRDI